MGPQEGGHHPKEGKESRAGKSRESFISLCSSVLSSIS